MKTRPTESQRQQAQRAVEDLRTALDLDEVLGAAAAHRWSGRTGDGIPTLHLDDVSAIPFLIGVPGVEEYQHRARLRAGDGDLFATVTPPQPGYEEYCQRLGLGTPELVVAVPTDGPLAVARAVADGAARERLVEVCREHGALRIHPYMSIESVWELAATLAGESDARVEVIGPPPPVTWIANDKQKFRDVVERIMGPGWVVEARCAADAHTLADHLLALAEHSARVALKRVRCASSMGNIVFQAGELLRVGHEGTRVHVEAFLEKTEWDEAESVLVVPWLDASSSPSTQLWIPEPEHGPPELQGIYVQLLKGTEQIFVGSRPTTLPAQVNEALGEAALRVASGLQALGYVGRCSFDHLVVGDPDGDFRILFTECNGRWGGTSTPMNLVDRLVTGTRPPYRAQDFDHDALRAMPFTEILERVGDEVFDPATGRGRFVFYNVGPLEQFGKLDVIAFGETQEEAERGVEDVLPARLGL